MPNSLYSRYLDFAPSFRWGGREWGAGDEAAFRRRMGKRYPKWARRHQTAARVFDPIEQQIYGAYQPELAAIDRERERTASMYDRRARNLGGFAAALGSLLSGGPGAMRDLYGQGAGAMRSAAGGYGNQLNADQGAQAAQNNAYLETIGSPAREEGGDAGGVLAGAAGWIPSQMMGEQGAAWSDRMAHLPTEAALQANLMMKDLMEQSREDDSEFSGKITDILSGLAGDRMKLRQGYEDQRLEKLKADRDYAMKQAALAFSMGKQKDYLYWKRRAYELDQLQERRYQNKDKGLDIDGNPLPGYHIGPNGRVVKDKKAKTSSSKVPNWGKIQADIADEDLTTKGVDPSRPWAGETDLPMDYKTAYRTLWAKYSGMVQNKARLRRLINQILKAKGIKKPAAPSKLPPYPPELP